MACLLNKGYSLGCRDSSGGLDTVYLGNFPVGQTYTFDTDNSILTATGSSTSYYTFNQEMETAEFNQTGAYSTENGTVYFDMQLTLVFHKNDADLRSLLLVLSQANLQAIVTDQRGEHWLIGMKNGARVINGSMNTGKAFGDMNGVSITIQSKEPTPAYRIDDLSTFNIVPN
jgi:hypothetical protein